MELKLVKDAEKKVLSAINEVYESDGTVQVLANQTSVEIRELLELNEMQRAAYNRVKGLQLRIKMLRNIRMNWPVWQQQNEHIDVRLNQLKGLRQFVQFLEDEDYEFEAEANDDSAEDEDRNPLVGHYVQPTGAGKTGLFAIETALVGLKTIVFVPFDNLMYQTADDFTLIGGIPENDIGVLSRKAPKDLYGRRVLITTYGGHLARMKRDEEYRRMVQEECELVWCDEGHMALGARTQEEIEAIDELALEEMTQEEREAETEVLGNNGKYIPSKAVKVAFTATPKLAKKHVRQKFGRCIGRVYQAELVKAGVNVPYRIIHTDGAIEDGDQVMDKMTEEEEVKVLRREEVYSKLLTEYAAAISTYHGLKKGDTNTEMPVYGMAFCTNHAECEKFKKDAEALGLRFEILTGEELAGGEKGRRQLKEAEGRLLRHEIDGFVTVEKLATGYSPNFMNTILWARVTSSARTVQGIGRGGRRHTYPGGIRKTHCTVIETNWTLSKNAKRGKKTPLRLADALFDQGEDPEAICGMANGEPLDVRRPVTPEKIREILLQSYTPKTWISLTGKQRAKIEIDGNKITAIASMFGLEGDFLNNRQDWIRLGKAIWQDTWGDPEKEERDFVRSLIKSRYTQQEWVNFSQIQKKAIEIDGGKITALTTLFNVVGNPASVHADYVELTKAIWEEEWSDPEERERERIRCIIREIHTPKTWVAMSSEERRVFKVEDKKISNLMGFFNLKGKRANSNGNHLALGQAIWGETWGDPEAEERERVCAIIRASYNPLTWSNLKKREKDIIKIEDMTLNVLATFLNFEGDPVSNRDDQISLGKIIWGDEWGDPESEQREVIRAAIFRAYTYESWIKMTQIEKKDVLIEGLKLDEIGRVFNIEGRPGKTQSIHIALARRIWNEAH